MSAAEDIQDHPDTVSTCARLALAEADGDVAEATKLLITRVRNDKELRRELLEPLIEYACHQAVARELRSGRSGIWRPVSPERLAGMSDAERVKALAAGNLLMFPLPGGKRLGDASRDDISQASRFYEKQAGDMAHKARWLQLIAQSVPPGKTVRGTITEDRLRELQEEAKRV